MKTKRIVIILFILVVCVIAGCTQAERVSYNLNKEADNFNIVRRLTVINCITGDTLFVMEGKMSVNDDGSVLRIYVEDNGTYKKHMVGLSDNVTYTLEDLSTNAVDKHKYTINFNPKMWIPFGVDHID